MMLGDVDKSFMEVQGQGPVIVVVVVVVVVTLFC
jgi:hypothetical protein